MNSVLRKLRLNDSNFVVMVIHCFLGSFFLALRFVLTVYRYHIKCIIPLCALKHRMALSLSRSLPSYIQGRQYDTSNTVIQSWCHFLQLWKMADIAFFDGTRYNILLFSNEIFCLTSFILHGTRQIWCAALPLRELLTLSCGGNFDSWKFLGGCERRPLKRS